MRGERLDAVERRRLRDRRLQREPLVDDQRIVGVAGVEIVERGRALRHVAAATASRAPPCGRSCCRRPGTAARRAKWRPLGASPRPEGRGRHCAARAGRRRPHRGGRAAVGEPAIAVESGPARCSPIAARNAVRRREDRVGIDVAADLAGDVGLARQRQRQRDEGRLERAVGQDRAERRQEARILRAAPPARSAATLSTSKRVASVCTACQRLNGSASCAARKRRSSADRLATSLIGAEKPRLSERHRRFADVGEHEGLGGLGQRQHAALDRAPVARA